jgi:hypothetical protein
MIADMGGRTQITMDSGLRRRAHAKAAALGITFAEYVRRLVKRDLDDSSGKVDVSILFDLGASTEPTDIARDKDKMLGQAARAQYRRKTTRRSQRLS